jgi:VanZ family protein
MFSINRRTGLFLLWTLTIAWLCFAWFLSSQTGDASGRLSGYFSKLISQLFNLSAETVPQIDAMLRKSAHFGVFFILAGLASLSTVKSFYRNRGAWFWPLPLCVLISVADEIRKSLIPGRHTSYSEAGLNALGCIAGAVIIWALTGQSRSK